MFMDIARDLARWVFWTTLGLEWAYIAVELACAIQKRLALMHCTTRAKPLPAWAVVNVVRRVVSKVAAREGAVVPLRFVEHSPRPASSASELLRKRYLQQAAPA